MPQPLRVRFVLFEPERQHQLIFLQPTAIGPMRVAVSDNCRHVRASIRVHAVHGSAYYWYAIVSNLYNMSLSTRIRVSGLLSAVHMCVLSKWQ